MKTRTVTVLKWIGVGAMVAGVAYGVLLMAASRRLRQEYEALRADGRPMQASEIIPKEVPAPDNAALVYRTAIQMLEAERPLALDASKTPQTHGTQTLWSQLCDVARNAQNPTNAAAAEQLRLLLQDKVVLEALDRVERGTTRPGYWQDLDYSKGPGILLPHLSQYRDLSRVLAAKARQHAAEGDATAAWRAVASGLRFADAAKNEPILISQLVRVAQAGIAIETLQRVAEKVPPPMEVSAEAQNLLASFDNRAPGALAFAGERLIFGEWVWNRSASELSSVLEEGWWAPNLYKTLLRPAYVRDHAAYLHVMRTWSRKYAESPSQNGTVPDDRVMSDVPRYCVFTRMLAPALSKVHEKFGMLEAQTRVTRAGLAAIRYRQEKGRYPTDVQTLSVVGLNDPFTGKPLIYRSERNGFVVYSVGLNFRDDGGTESKERGQGDIVWRYEEPTEAGPRSGGDRAKSVPDHA